ncbi:hypothetical protein SO802_028969 [Lithocarpus litseifolius]|uniref:EF-hand domain-containing protein n=1 Tax=Lithocarpus litseifolius TaxID=425828 RepID=A0AAW2BRP5_9ROSI
MPESRVDLPYSSGLRKRKGGFGMLVMIPWEKKAEPVYHPTAEEISASMGAPMEGFFNRADVVFETTASTTLVAAQGVPAEVPIPSIESVPMDEGTHIERASETTHIPAEILTLEKRAIPPVAAQTDAVSPTTPMIISTIDPFTALFQAVKDGSSLMITPSIPSSATRGPDADLSSKDFDEVLEDPNDEPTMKKRVSEFDKDEEGDHEVEFMEAFKELGVALPTATSPTTPAMPVRTIPAASTSAISPAPIFAIPITPTGLTPTIHSQFQVGSSSSTVLDPELISVGFTVEFILDHLREIARAFFMRSVQPTVDAIEGRRVRLLSSVGGSSHFGDQPLISELR